jgi:beta-ureidopropionase / N-carbamoyl-L-amino-acid hydrolase
MTDLPSIPSIDGPRLWTSIMDLARIGATQGGGVSRLALTDLDKEARCTFIKWAREAGCETRVDAIGNIFARRRGRSPDRPAILMGSHIDTQPGGGKFDGNYGVLAGLEIMRSLRDNNIETDADIEVVVWTNEEGSRFVPLMMGSGVFSGVCSLSDALSARDSEGVSVGEELTRIGFAGDGHVPHAVDSYFEAHIEQGPVLERTERTIGVVVGALGQRWFDCTVTGFESHAGPTPMTHRRDALQAASILIQRVVELAKSFAPNARGTVGQVAVHPNSRNVIPGRVHFSVDLRAEDEETLDSMASSLCETIETIKQNQSILIDLVEVSRVPAMRFDADCVALVDRSAREAGYDPLEIVSGAGHDAINLAKVAPSAMIFIPCEGGVSHNEIEHAEPDHVTAGANVLMRCICHRAGIVGVANPSH